MFQGWENYYLMIGSSAGALIGLMFVVMTLTAGRDPAEVEQGKTLYSSPIVWHLAVILVLSGAAAAPVMPIRLFAGITVGLGILGIILGIRSTAGILRFFSSNDPGFDALWYGVAPTVVYLGLLAAGLGMLFSQGWGPAAVSADLMALLLVSIHAEWDLVTYLAPSAGKSGEAAKDP